MIKKLPTKKAFVISSLRRCSFRWPGRYTAMQRARVRQERVRGRLVWHYSCVMCKDDIIHSAKNIRMDHKIPVVDPVKGFPLLPDGREDWTTYIDRLFCDEAGFQVLCLSHHAEKTKTETDIRKLTRQIKKNALAMGDPAVFISSRIRKKKRKGRSKCG